MAKRRRPTAKQAKFIREYLSGKGVQEALRDAGYKGNNLAVVGNRYLNLPHIRAEFNRLLDEMYPNLDAKIAKFVNNIFDQEKILTTKATCPNCKHEFEVEMAVPAIKTGDQIRMFEALARVKGWNAPSKSAQVKVDVTDFFKLPTDKNDGEEK